MARPQWCPSGRTGLVNAKTWPVQNPENRSYKQEADEPRQSGQKPDLLLMR
jgi:hypothetical protein